MKNPVLNSAWAKLNKAQRLAAEREYVKQLRGKGMTLAQISELTGKSVTWVRARLFTRT